MALHFNNPEDQKWYLRVKDLTSLTDIQISKISEENGGLTQAYQAGIFCPHCCLYDASCDKNPVKKAREKQSTQENGKIVLAVIVGVRSSKPNQEKPDMIDIESLLNNNPPKK